MTDKNIDVFSIDYIPEELMPGYKEEEYKEEAKKLREAINNLGEAWRLENAAKWEYKQNTKLANPGEIMFDAVKLPGVPGELTEEQRSGIRALLYKAADLCAEEQRKGKALAKGLEAETGGVDGFGLGVIGDRLRALLRAYYNNPGVNENNEC